MTDLYDPKIDDCVSNIQIGIMCPNRKPPQEEAKKENGKA